MLSFIGFIARRRRHIDETRHRNIIKYLKYCLDFARIASLLFLGGLWQ